MTVEEDLNPEELQKEVIKLVEEIIKKLNNKNIILFKNKPTINIFHLRDKIIGISLIDENKGELKCEQNQNPKRGKIYFFLSKLCLNDFYDYEIFAEDKVQEIIEEIQSENAYSLNMKRVRELIKDGHNAVAIVFLISAFENATKDLFLNNNYLWFFPIEASVNQDLLEEFGVKVDENNKALRPFYFVGEEGWYFDDENYKKYNNWSRIEHMNYVFNLCKSVRILEQYKLSLLGNNTREIGFYEILKKIISKSLGKSSIINFQSITGKGSVRWSFKKFFSIDLTPMNQELNFLQEVINKRHHIIHGFLEDDKIDKPYVEKAYDSVSKIISFLKDQIYEWYRVVP